MLCFTQISAIDETHEWCLLLSAVTGEVGILQCVGLSSIAVAVSEANYEPVAGTRPILRPIFDSCPRVLLLDVTTFDGLNSLQ